MIHKTCSFFKVAIYSTIYMILPILIALLYNNILEMTSMSKIIKFLFEHNIILVFLNIIFLYYILDYKISFFNGTNIYSKRIIILCMLLGIFLNLFSEKLIFFTKSLFSTIETNELYIQNNNMFFSYILVIGILIPIIEECIFREVIFKELCNVIGITSSIIIQSILFSIIHISFYKALSAFVFGIILNVIYIWFKSIIYPIIIHVIFNVCSIIFNYFKIFFHEPTTLLICLILITIIVFLLYKYKKRVIYH